MKKILGIAVAVAFVLAAVAVKAEDKKATELAKPATEKVTIQAKEVVTKSGKVEEKVTGTVKAPGVKEEIKIVEKVDTKTVCLAKYPGKKATDKEVTDCIAKETSNVKEATKVAVEKAVKANEPVKTPTVTTTTAKTVDVKKEIEKKN